MLFEETPLAGAYIISLQPVQDDRGYFARSFCREEMGKRGLECDFVQGNISYNQKKGTLRGLHYQLPPHEEVKIVSCRRGVIYDVIVDIRSHSSTYGQWIGRELSAQNGQAFYIPRGFAHGFQTLADETEVHYLMGNYYHPSSARGIRWNDTKLGIKWPYSDIIMSERDMQFPEFVL